MLGINSPELARNAGFYSKEQQEAYLRSTVAIAGTGGEGFNLALLLARSGVQRFKIADPEVFERENINRVPGARESTIGRNKAEVLAEDIRDINPDAECEVWSEGISHDSAGDFVRGADLVFDGVDLHLPYLSVALYRAARRAGIVAMMSMNIADSAIATSFKPRGGVTFEDLLGIPNDTPLDRIENMDIPLSRTVPHIPPYENIGVLKRIRNGDMPLPSLATGVALATSLAAVQARRHLDGYFNEDAIWAKRFGCMDMGGKYPRGNVIRFPRAHHYGCLVMLTLRSSLGLNHKTGGYGDMLESQATDQ